MPYVEIATSVIVMPPKLWAEKLQVAIGLQGVTMTAFVNLAIADYFCNTLEFYLKCAELDAEARGYESASNRSYYADLRDSKSKFQKDTPQESLKPWSTPPKFGPSPLAEVEMSPHKKENLHRLKTIRLSDYNYVLLKLALIIDDYSLVEFISRVLSWHFQECWDMKGSYGWQQLGAEKRCLVPFK